MTAKVSLWLAAAAAVLVGLACSLGPAAAPPAATSSPRPAASPAPPTATRPPTSRAEAPSPTTSPTPDLLATVLPPPGAEITPWEQLIDASLLEGVEWTRLEGTLQGGGKGVYVPFSLLYPQDWYVVDAFDVHVALQNVPPDPRPPEGPFAKFEILWLKEPPMPPPGPAPTPPPPLAAYTVLLAGEPAVLTEDETSFGAILAKDGALYSLAGYLGHVDEAQRAYFRSLIFEMMASLMIGSPR